MTSRKFSKTTTGLLGFLVLSSGAFTLTACSKEEAKPAPPPKQTYQAPEPELGPLDEIDLDSRVEFPEDRAPQDHEAAVAVAGIASAIASGDEDEMGGWITNAYRPVLDELIADGAWRTTTGEIEVVRICSLDHDEDRMRLALGIQDAKGAYLLGWNGRLTGSQWRFEPIAIESQYALAANELDDAPLLGPIIAEAEFEVAPEPTEERPKETGGRRGGGLRGGGPGLR